MIEWLIDMSAWVLPILLAITLHEAAHGWMAERFGDDTARILGRVTFNPIKHIDRFGTVILPGMLALAQSPVLFGYAKPVPVDFRRLHPHRLGMFMVAFAGPGINLILAFIGGLLLHVDQLVTPENAPWIFMNLYRFIMINCVLAVFNMLPILPLDGGRVVASFLHGKALELFSRFERWGILIVLGLALIPALLGYPIVQEAIGIPIFWLMEQMLWLSGNSG